MTLRLLLSMPRSSGPPAPLPAAVRSQSRHSCKFPALAQRTRAIRTALTSAGG